MGENILNVTEGSGLKLHTWSKTVGANTVHDEFTLPGEYPLASYSVYSSSISTATVDSHILQLMAGSSLNVRVRRITIQQFTNATTGAVDAFHIFRLTTAGTGGGSLTPQKFNNADAAAGATAMTLPTAKGTEASTPTLSGVLTMRQTVATSGAQANDRWEWEQHPGEGPIVIAAGTSNGICVKNAVAVAGATVIVTIEFVETSF